MRLAPLAAVALALSASCASAQARRNYTVIDPGREAPVFGSGKINKTDCSSVASMLVMRRPPEHGAVRFAEKDAVLGGEVGACPTGTPAHRMLALYRPRPGYTGLDQFWVYDGGSPDGTPGQLHQVVVYVRDPHHPNTGTPNVADLDAMLGPVSAGPGAGGSVAGIAAAQHVHVKTRDVLIREREVDVGQAAVAVHRRSY